MRCRYCGEAIMLMRGGDVEASLSIVEHYLEHLLGIDLAAHIDSCINMLCRGCTEEANADQDTN